MILNIIQSIYIYIYNCIFLSLYITLYWSFISLEAKNFDYIFLKIKLTRKYTRALYEYTSKIVQRIRVLWRNLYERAWIKGTWNEEFRWAQDTYKTTIMINDDELSDHIHISQSSALALCVWILAWEESQSLKDKSDESFKNSIRYNQLQKIML